MDTPVRYHYSSGARERHRGDRGPEVATRNGASGWPWRAGWQYVVALGLLLTVVGPTPTVVAAETATVRSIQTLQESATRPVQPDRSALPEMDRSVGWIFQFEVDGV